MKKTNFHIPNLGLLEDEIIEAVNEYRKRTGRTYVDCSNKKKGTIPVIEYTNDQAKDVIESHVLAVRASNYAKVPVLEIVTTSGIADPEDENAWFTIHGEGVHFADAVLSIAENIGHFLDEDTYDLNALSELCCEMIGSDRDFTGPVRLCEKDNFGVSGEDLFLTKVKNPTGTAILLSWAFEGDFTRALVIPSSEFYREQDGTLGRVVEALESFVTAD